jgi:DEAD/DEAH box helicase domain-containing protein
VASFDVDRNIHSFVAALDLGLRRKFQGDPGHLLTTVTDEPVPGSDVRKRYLVLYDGVPGGTGYLKELMRDQQNLLEVFEKAYNVLKSCTCQSDPEKDGCYRCLLAYRGRHDQQNTSRQAALGLLKLILDNRQYLKRTQKLDFIRINSLLESELEGRFIEALRRTPEGDPPRSVTHQVVNGKEGFYFRSEGESYLIEPQVELGPWLGVAIPSRADFVFYPERPAKGELPIAVFTDGFEYHADPNGALRTGLDTSQRLALMRSGRYRVWSLNWDDVQEQFQYPIPQFEPSLLSPGARFGALINSLDPANASNWQRLAGMSSFESLLLLLGAGRQWPWTRLAQAFAVSLLETDPSGPGRLRLHWERKHSDGSPLLCAEGGMDATALQRRDFVNLSVRLNLFDDYAHHGLIEWKRAWREFLRLGNLLQFLDRFEFVTAIGLAGEVYGPLLEQAEKPGEETMPNRLAALLELVDSKLHSLCRKLAERGKALPEAGYELASDGGEIVATAELAWPNTHIALLLGQEADGAARFEASGWLVFQADSTADAPELLLNLLPNEVS